MTVSWYYYNGSHSLQYDKYTKWINIAKGIANFRDKIVFEVQVWHKNNKTIYQTKILFRAPVMEHGISRTAVPFVTNGPRDKWTHLLQSSYFYFYILFLLWSVVVRRASPVVLSASSVNTLETTFCETIFMKLGQNVCFDIIETKFQNIVCLVKN